MRANSQKEKRSRSDVRDAMCFPGQANLSPSAQGFRDIRPGGAFTEVGNLVRRCLQVIHQGLHDDGQVGVLAEPLVGLRAAADRTPTSEDGDDGLRRHAAAEGERAKERPGRRCGRLGSGGGPSVAASRTGFEGYHDDDPTHAKTTMFVVGSDDHR